MRPGARGSGLGARGTGYVVRSDNLLVGGLNVEKSTVQAGDGLITMLPHQLLPRRHCCAGYPLGGVSLVRSADTFVFNVARRG